MLALPVYFFCSFANCVILCNHVNHLFPQPYLSSTPTPLTCFTRTDLKHPCVLPSPQRGRQIASALVSCTWQQRYSRHTQRHSKRSDSLESDPCWFGDQFGLPFVPTGSEQRLTPNRTLNHSKEAKIQCGTRGSGTLFEVSSELAIVTWGFSHGLIAPMRPAATISA